MRKLKTLLTLGLATLSLGAMAQAPPPRPPVGGPGVGPGPGGPDLLMDPKVQRELNLSQTQIAKIRAIRPLPPKPGARPPLPPKTGARPPMPPKPGARPPEEAKIDAVLTKPQRIKLREIRARQDRKAPTPPAAAPRPTKP